ncbi:MAG: hypothetical protein ACKVP5_22545 [Aestuariivirga sp.]
MAKKKPRAIEGFIMFDVVYEDGTRSSRRKVAATELAEHGDDHALTAIMNQDRKIAEMSGKNRGPIRSLERSDG